MKIKKPRIKICGIQSPAIADQATRLGADYIGIMLHPLSRRYVDIVTARAVVAAAKRGGAVPVPVVVDQTLEEIRYLCNTLDVQVVQLHGDASREQHQQLPRSIHKIYVLHVNEQGEVVNANKNFTNELNVDRDYLLFDGLIGGSGKRIITDHIETVSGNFKYFIAGGLSSRNIAEVIRNNPSLYGVDISSGVENQQAKKDSHLIKQFILAAQ